MKKIETILSATEARKKFFMILKKIKKLAQVYTITLGGKPRAVILSVEEYEAWRETIEIISNSEILKDLKEAKKTLRSVVMFH